jgi:hypothetical protein
MGPDATGQIDEAVEAMRQEASPPRRDAHAADTERAGDATVVEPRSAQARTMRARWASA